MPIRLIAIDLDGTLLNSESQITSASREALAAAARKGVQIVIVTGRRFHSARPFLESIPQDVTLISDLRARSLQEAGRLWQPPQERAFQSLLSRAAAFILRDLSLNQSLRMSP